MTDRSVLDRISIASPCSANWDQMQGDDRRRFCADCKLHVHDLSRMTADEAITLLHDAGRQRVCVRLYRRADGTVLTRDCPVGLRQRLRRMVAQAGALWLVLTTGLAACMRPRAEAEAPNAGAPSAPAAPESPPERLGEVEMGDFVAPRETPTAPPVGGGEVEMGKMRVAPK
jgi:hypothetical protein